MAGERDEYLAVLKALYDYEHTSEDELSIKEDQILFLVERTDEEWWKVKHKPDSQDDETAPPGLVPASYLEEVEPTSVVKALYDYEAAAPGELSVTEGEALLVQGKDEEWLLVKTERDGGKVGYVPENYVESGDEETVENEASRIVIPDSPPQRPTSTYVDPADRVAATTDKAKADDIQTWAVSEVDKKGKKKKGTLGVGNGAIFFASESDKTPVQKWQTSAIEDIKIEKSKHVHLDIGAPTPVNLHFNVGNKDTADAVVKKLQSSKALAAGPPSSPPPSSSPTPAPLETPSQARTPLALALPGAGTKPNKNGASVHFAQAAAVIPPPDTPVDTEPDEDGVSVEGEMGSALYDFAADGEDELSVREGEQLVILDKDSSDEWWKCRNMNGAEGVVPASYIEASGGGSGATQEGEDEDTEAHERAVREEAEREEAERAAAEAEVLAAQARERSEKERERKKQEADRKAKAAAAAAKAEKERRDREAQEREERATQEREAAELRLAEDAKRSRESARPRASEEDRRRSSKRREATSPDRQPKFPNAGKTRIWHDHSGQWRTEAEFLGISKGKIRLHKINGVVIEVPPEKMSPDDVRYIENITKQKLAGSRAPRSRAKDDDDIPLGTLSSKASRPAPPAKKAPTVDWFEFFLNAGCELDDCTRYATSFERDKIDEAILPDIKDSTLRSLGLREGDIIRVMKVIEQRKPKAADGNDSLKAQLARDEEIAKALQAEEDGGSSSRHTNATSPAPNLFTGPGGALKPRRGRPQPRGSAPPVNVDVNSIASASDQISRTGSPLISSPGAERASPANPSVPKRPASTQPSGFDDDAWTNRPSSTKPTPTGIAATPASPAPPPPAPPAPTPPVPTAPAPTTSPTAPAVAAAAQVPLPPTSETASPSQNSSHFEILAKIGQMRPPPAPASQPSMLGRSSPVVASPPPQSFQSGLGMGSSPVPMGQHLQHHQSGLYAQQAQNGPRGPLAPVLGNQSLLNPLIPTSTGFNQFVPTRPVSNPPLQPPMQQSFQSQGQPSFLSSPPPGFGQNVPLMSQQTGFPGMMPQQTGMFSGVSSQPTGFAGNGFGGGSLPNFMPPSGFGGAQSNATGFNPSFSQPSLNSSNLTSGSAAPPQKDHSPANVFAQMKSGTFGEDSTPQPADKYDALRPQPTGFVYQQNGYQQQGPYGGY